ncbi:MAG: transporter substrate-binding domain-containing protein [Desulfocapsa sp.]|nr:transporter substrate-binding domain-containing protein [Desulfocapsa sp.]
MKKHGMRIILILFLFMGQTVFAGDREKLIITGHPSYAPVSWEKDGAIMGASTKMIELIARDLGIPVESRSMGSWANAQNAIREGAADIIFGLYYNDDRAGYMHYIEPAYMLDPVVLMVPKGKTFGFDKWSDLSGKKGITNEGESYGPEFDAYMADKLTVNRGKGLEECFQILLQGNADYMIVGLYPGIAEAKKLKIWDKLEPIPRQLKAFKMYVAFSRKSSFYDQYHLAFAEKIRAMVNDGTVQTLLILSQAEWVETNN